MRCAIYVVKGRHALIQAYANPADKGQYRVEVGKDIVSCITNRARAKIFELSSGCAPPGLCFDPAELRPKQQGVLLPGLCLTQWNIGLNSRVCSARPLSRHNGA